MPVDVNNLWVFRITHYQNLEYILQHGIYYRGNPNFPADYVNIGNPDIISRRDEKPVRCYPGTMVNDYVPFYFAVRTPMLLNIHTGYGVEHHPQHEIIYICCKVAPIMSSDLQWCFTNGNASMDITRFYIDAAELDGLDWRSIRTTDFRDDNADGDPDRKRKKHAEFLVREHVPVQFIQRIVVYNQHRHDHVAALVVQYNRDITVHINPDNQFYF